MILLQYHKIIGIRDLQNFLTSHNTESSLSECTHFIEYLKEKQCKLPKVQQRVNTITLLDSWYNQNAPLMGEKEKQTVRQCFLSLMDW